MIIPGMFQLGLTGSIAMGKSTTAQFFRDEGIPVWDADETVHRLYSTCETLIEKIRSISAGLIIGDKVDRAALRQWIAGDATALKALEDIVHPFVSRDRQEFVDACNQQGHALIVLDVPLLFETNAQDQFDAVLVVTAPSIIQRERVLARSDMTADHLDTVLRNQMPDVEKRQRADFVIATVSLAVARSNVQNLIVRLSQEARDNA